MIFYFPLFLTIGLTLNVNFWYWILLSVGTAMNLSKIVWDMAKVHINKNNK